MRRLENLVAPALRQDSDVMMKFFVLNPGENAPKLIHGVPSLVIHLEDSTCVTPSPTTKNDNSSLLNFIIEIES